MVTKKIKIPFLLMIGILILAFASSLMAKQNPADLSNQGFAKVAAADKYTRTLSNISNWSYWLYYDGLSANDPNGASGGIYPRKTAGVIFQDGIVWGGYVRDNNARKPKLRVGGQTYNIGTTPGWIVTEGYLDATPDTLVPPVAVVPDDDPRVRIYRIRQDYVSLTLKDDAGNFIGYDPSILQDAAEVNFTGSESVTDAMQQGVVDQYALDWKEWPVELGAPYYDEDGNGSYNPVLVDGVPQIGDWDEVNSVYTEYYDRPGTAGADQVIWFVANDATESRTLKLYGSPTMGMELQVTAWGYNQPNSTLGQMFFKKFKFINKSGAHMDSMFVAQWSDPDLGNSSDDLGGCDVHLSLGYAFNGFRTDNQFSPFGLPPAAVGYDFFQGPLVDGVAGEDLNANGVDDADDYAVFNLTKVGPGKINLPMTSFLYFAAGSPITDPDLGEYSSTEEWYNMLNGFTPTDDLDNPTPYTVGNVAGGTPTLFPLSGDPFLGIGDIDGQGTNLPPGDRRIGLASGPFSMAPGDEQELVVAVVGGIIKQEGGNNTNAIAQMKLNDAYAQFLYDNLFAGVPSPPKAPSVTFNEFDGHVTFDWGSNTAGVAETERDDPVLGFDFQGYNVYQMPNESSSKEQATLVATYDVVDRVGIIRTQKFLPTFGDVVTVPVQYGTDSGLKRFLNVDHDYVNDLPLYNGNTYYFAITAYNYNPDPNVPEQSLESALTVIKVVPQPDKPGFDNGALTGDLVDATHSAGAAEQLTVDVTVVDPKKITGDDYNIFFDNWHFYRNLAGVWVRTAFADSVADLDALSKTSDVSPSSFSGSAIASASVGTIDLVFTLDLQAPGGAWVDGVEIDLPDDMTVNSWSGIAGAYSSYGAASGQNVPNPDGTLSAGNVLTWGDSARSTFGGIEGTIFMTVNVEAFTFPTDVGYKVFDDAYDGTTIDAVGTLTLDELGYEFKTVPMWNLKNTTQNTIVLEGQEKLWTADEAAAAPIVDGYQIAVGGSFEAPTDFQDVLLVRDGEESSVAAFAQLADYTVHNVSSYGYAGWAADGTAIAARGLGISDLSTLIQDYELRWTGEFEPVTVGSQVIMHVKEGTGSMARLYLARSDDLGLHPMNPTAGSLDPFMVRIPFEVWNTVEDKQINIDLVDRLQTFSTNDTVWAFNPYGRMYCELVNTDYKETLYTAEDLDNMTWNLIFWEAPYVTGDVLKIVYANPILLGIDEYTFSTAGLGESYDAAEAKEDVGEVNVFPNPYYAYNPAEPDRFTRYVTFTHLPPNATIRLFDLSGAQVRKLEKEVDTQSQFLRWDLRNESDIPVASGIYIAHIDMPDENKTKVLKVFIIQAQEQLKYY